MIFHPLSCGTEGVFSLEVDMINVPMDVLTNYQVRKSKKQKQVFRDAVWEYAEKLGYPVQVKSGSFGVKNLIIGDPENAKFLITAHYDTCAWMPFPNWITPCNLLVYLAYQLLVVFVLIAVAVGVGFGVSSWTSDSQVAYFACLAVYWLLLIGMLNGPANRHTANDNTSGVITVLEIARDLPESLRSQVCFVLFDLEEAGLRGSSAYRSAFKKQTEHQIVLNLDCVGDGDHIVMFPTRKMRKDNCAMELLRKSVGSFENKSISIHESGFSHYPSDQANFPKGVGIAALHKGKIGLWLGRIHTHRDTVLEETNINILRDAILSIIGESEAINRKETEYETI